MVDFLSLQINRLQRQKNRPFLEGDEKGIGDGRWKTSCSEDAVYGEG